jgi:hypothetical protein
MRDNEDSAAAHDNQVAQSLVFRTAVTVMMVELSSGTPNRVPPVAKPWLVVTESDIIIPAAKATTERKSLNGMLLVVVMVASY